MQLAQTVGPNVGIVCGGYRFGHVEQRPGNVDKDRLCRASNINAAGSSQGPHRPQNYNPKPVTTRISLVG